MSAVFTKRVRCPKCGSTQAVNQKTKPLRMWSHGSCVNVLAPPDLALSGRCLIDCIRTDDQGHHFYCESCPALRTPPASTPEEGQ